MKCINCGNKKLRKIVSMGSQPLSGIFYKKKNYNLRKYPLDLYRCNKCTLVQLRKTAKKIEMFGKTYEYRTSLSNLMITHIKNKIKYLKSNNFLKKRSNILDIGSNDGTFLNYFDKSNNLIGVDPSADKFKKFYKKNIHVCSDFFSKKILNNFNKQKKISINQFDIITSFAMFYDVDDPNSFCKDIESSLTDNGVWMLELSYLPLMLKNLTYDQICHEHIGYYTLTSFKKIAEKNKMKIIDIGFNEINGGSIEIVCSKINSKFIAKSKKIQKVLIDEKKIKISSYKNFNTRINEVKKKLQTFIQGNSKKKILGYGASTKGNIVLSHCKINNKQIRYVGDGSIRKKGRYTPGTNIKIISKKMMRVMKPNYLLVLIWSFRKEVIKQELDFLQKGGELVFHLPRFHIINIRNYKYFLKNDFKKLAYKY
jgi:NDP-4-keto-2,6-dideoxyhexose 3-C-methyltransferase